MSADDKETRVNRPFMIEYMHIGMNIRFPNKKFWKNIITTQALTENQSFMLSYNANFI